MRNISFALTAAQFRARTKDVTRRLGWRNLKAGQELCGCLKCQGIPKGGQIERLGPIRVVSVRFEPLRRLSDDLDYGFEEICREGFGDDPRLSWPSVWVPWFCSTHAACTPDTEVTRIEFAYL